MKKKENNSDSSLIETTKNERTHGALYIIAKYSSQISFKYCIKNQKDVVNLNLMCHNMVQNKLETPPIIIKVERRE